MSTTSLWPTTPSLRPKVPSARPKNGSLRPRSTGMEVGPKILVIDDDAMLRRVLTRGLRRRHVVEEREDAAVALTEILGGARYDAIVCDLGLTGMTGRQFVLSLNAIAPEQAAKVVILTGSSKDSLDEVLLAVVGSRFVEKPATLNEIELVLGEVCGARANAA